MMPGGQPTKYKKEFCDKIIEFLREGNTVTQFAASLDVSKESIYEWRRVHKEFSDAFTRAKAKSEAHWTTWLQNNLSNPKANGALVKLYFTNCFGWSDKKEVHQETVVSIAEETKRKVRNVLDE